MIIILGVMLKIQKKVLALKFMYFMYLFKCQIILDVQDGEKLKTFSKKIKENISLFMKFVNSSTTTLTRKLNKISRDYRYVIRTLAVEKKTLKVFFYKNSKKEVLIATFICEYMSICMYVCISAKPGFWNWFKNRIINDLATYAICW